MDWPIPGRKGVEWLAEQMKSDTWVAWEVVGKVWHKAVTQARHDLICSEKG